MHYLRLLSEGEGASTGLLWVLYGLGAFFLLAIVAGWLGRPKEQNHPPVVHEAEEMPASKRKPKLVSKKPAKKSTPKKRPASTKKA